MKFSLTIINKNPRVSIRVTSIPNVEERVQITGRELHATEAQVYTDAEEIINIEQTLERLLGVRVHLSEAE